MGQTVLWYPESIKIRLRRASYLSHTCNRNVTLAQGRLSHFNSHNTMCMFHNYVNDVNPILHFNSSRNPLRFMLLREALLTLEGGVKLVFPSVS